MVFNNKFFSYTLSAESSASNMLLFSGYKFNSKIIKIACIEMYGNI